MLVFRNIFINTTDLAQNVKFIHQLIVFDYKLPSYSETDFSKSIALLLKSSVHCSVHSLRTLAWIVSKFLQNELNSLSKLSLSFMSNGRSEATGS